MQPSGVVVSKVEAKLQAAFKKLPVWVSTDCHFAYRKYHCSTNLTAPEGTTLQTELRAAGIGYTGSISTTDLSYEFYLPQYASKSVCLNYVSKCKKFLTRMKQPIPTCSTEAALLDTYNYQSATTFSTDNQVVMQLQFSGHFYSIEKTLNMSSSTTSLSTAVDTSGFHTQCPWGTVVPEDKSHYRVVMVSGTGCATACR
jgi:hypothetical protein